ncbi:proline-, glutamic acid- and leucine-rich protein 1-like [Papaver somniferum]|uniref:proline-, glutamic acid- and leucine-rich protein 1-like n=1 Tax=Papaver somniferum TaxID=3469 RepID=UPI000E6FEEE9|nr:proline-, glutamic acid- and leucine-rich protein 1-like [Papaver somniferum]
MAVFEYFDNMYDIRLKPKLLRSLIKDYLPDEKQPIPSPSQLSYIVSTIKTHGLLSECVSSNNNEPVEQKHMDKWKTTVDSWVERLLLLTSSKMPDKIWAGICLIGVTCQECSVDRFVASYSLWFQKLHSQIQSSSDSHFVKVATCASLSDMFTRLAGFSTMKKDATNNAGKLTQPILKQLAEESSEAVLDGAVDLLCTLIKYFPASVHRLYDSVEAVIVSKIMSGKCSAVMLKKFADCLALLPKIRGDEESWSLVMQKILISVNGYLTDAFQGLEEDSASREFLRLLVLPGKEPPPPLGGNLSVRTSNPAENRSEKLLLSRVSTLMLCCCTMLTNPYPVQVTIPVRPLLALVKRVLLVDGSLSEALMPFMTVMQQEFICSELPVLQLNSLDLLTAIIKGVRSQLLPYAADVVRLLTKYFKRCAFPPLRIKVYSITKILLISMGVGMALYLAQEVINNAFVDLVSLRNENSVASSSINAKAATDLNQPGNRKRKHGTVRGDQQSGVNLEVALLKSKSATPISVQIAALQALEALLTVGGALRSECWRSNIDLLLITVATNVCDGGWASEDKNASVSSGEQRTWANLQLAVLHALLASLLSPSRVCPPYLSRGLELFRRGKQETGTKLAEFCAHALRALEVLIHPRALPMTDFSSTHETFGQGFNQDNIFSSSKQNRFSGGILGMTEPDPDDDLYESWLGNGEETEAPVKNTDQEMKDAMVEPSTKEIQLTATDYPAGKGDGKGVAEEEKRDKFVVESERAQAPSGGDVGTTGEAVMEPTISVGVGERENKTTNKVIVAESSALDPNSKDGVTTVMEGNQMKSSKGVISAAVPSGDTPKTLSWKQIERQPGDDDSDLDSCPDIVYADPDSD